MGHGGIRYCRSGRVSDTPVLSSSRMASRQDWPRTDLEIHMLRSCIFTAQAIARDMIAAGREKEIEEIRMDVSKIAPELPEES